MTKHILDRSRAHAKGRLAQALGKQRADGPKDATLNLQRRRRTRAQTMRLAQFLRVAREMGH